MDINSVDITQEKAIIQTLGDAWNLYISTFGPAPLSGSGRDDMDDFRKCIHDAQRIVMAKICMITLDL